MDRQGAAAVSLTRACLCHQIGAVLVNANNLTAVQQQHEAHAIEPSIGAISVTAEHVEIGPSTFDCDADITVDENAGSIDDPRPTF